MKERLQITISKNLKEKMNEAKDSYGGYSGLIERAVHEFLSHPVVPDEDDIQELNEVINHNEWTSLDDLKKKIKR